MKTIIAALAAFAVPLAALPAAAQSLNHTPTPAEAQQARDNVKRDQKLADAMEKARLKEEAKPPSVYIPKEQPQPAIKEHKPEVFTAGAPGPKKAKAKKPKKDA